MTEEMRKRRSSTQGAKQEEPQALGPVLDLEALGEIMRQVIAHEIAPLQVEIAALTDHVATLNTQITKMQREIFTPQPWTEPEDLSAKADTSEPRMPQKNTARLSYREGLPVMEPMPIQLVGGTKK